MYRVAFVIAALAVAGCGGPSSEEPVDLEPGRYEIAISSRGPFGGDSGSKSLCVLPDRASSFTTNPLQGIGPPSSSACPLQAKRKGNAFSGSQNCSNESGEFGKSSLKLDYEGSLTKDSFRIDGNMQIEAAGRSGSGSFSVTGNRTGGC
jgi:hypothetical protein